MHIQNGLEFRVSTSNLVSGLRHAWSHLSSAFQGVASNERSSDESLLLNQDVSRAGFVAAGELGSLITNPLTMDLECVRGRSASENGARRSSPATATKAGLGGAGQR